MIFNKKAARFTDSRMGRSALFYVSRLAALARQDMDIMAVPCIFVERGVREVFMAESVNREGWSVNMN
jgi:hypothetical protein